MKIFASVLACIVSLAATVTLFAQDSVDKLQDLIGVRWADGSDTIRERGFVFVRSIDPSTNQVTYWRESSTGKCVSALSANGRFGGFFYVPADDCKVASGQSGSEAAERPASAARGVTLHRDLNLAGTSEVFAGDVPDLRGSRIGDNQATSVAITRGCRARLYRQPNYQGSYTEIDANVGDLRGSTVGDDSVSSVKVRCDVEGGSSATRGVTLHRDLNFTGASELFTDDAPDLRRTRIGDDQATSVSVSEGCRARLYQNLNFQGASTEVDANVSDLRGSRVGDDSATSLEVECDAVWEGVDWGDSGTAIKRGVTLHRDLNYGGVSEHFTGDVPDLRSSKIGNDQASSVSISEGCRARLYQSLNYWGAYTEVDSNVGDLRGSEVGNDSVTALRVRCDVDTESSATRGVTLYRDKSFTGVSEVFTGDAPDLRYSKIGNDHATSVRVSKGCRAKLHPNLNFEGASTEIDADVADLRGSTVGDDSVSSLEVDCEDWIWSDDWSGEEAGEAEDEWAEERAAQGSAGTRGVTLHRDLNYTGTSQLFSGDVPDLRSSTVGNDEATSVSISRGCRARLYQNLNYEGSYTEVDSNVGDLRGSTIGNDSVSSLKVRCESLAKATKARS